MHHVEMRISDGKARYVAEGAENNETLISYDASPFTTIRAQGREKRDWNASDPSLHEFIHGKYETIHEPNPTVQHACRRSSRRGEMVRELQGAVPTIYRGGSIERNESDEKFRYAAWKTTFSTCGKNFSVPRFRCARIQASQKLKGRNFEWMLAISHLSMAEEREETSTASFFLSIKRIAAIQYHRFCASWAFRGQNRSWFQRCFII